MNFEYLLKLPSGFGDPTTWVLIALVVFLGFLVYMKVPGVIARALDGRAEKIRNELDEARRLREEAQELLAEYKRKERKAEDEAAAIIEQAKKDAKSLQEQAQASLKETIDRRVKMAEAKIAQAEAKAAAEVRNKAAELAVAAAEAVIRKGLDKDEQKAIIAQGIEDVAKRMN